MEYAIVRLGGKQYKVKAGDKLEVDKLSTKDKSFDLSEVLLLVADGKVNIGKPVLSNAKVHVKNLGQIKGEKLRVSKFKAKSRYRRTIGFRPQLNVLQIEKIEISKKAWQDDIIWLIDSCEKQE